MDKQSYHTLLSFNADGYHRRDLCPNCFAVISRDGIASYWQGEYKAPPPPPVEAIQKDTAESLLRKLCESNDPSQGASRYILAVMLERKKVLRHRDTLKGDDDRELLVYEHAQTGETITVPDPQLRLDQLQDVQQQVAGLLGAVPSKKYPVSQARFLTESGEQDTVARVSQTVAR